MPEDQSVGLDAAGELVTLASGRPGWAVTVDRKPCALHTSTGAAVYVPGAVLDGVPLPANTPFVVFGASDVTGHRGPWVFGSAVDAVTFVEQQVEPRYSLSEARRMAAEEDCKNNGHRDLEIDVTDGEITGFACGHCRRRWSAGPPADGDITVGRALRSLAGAFWHFAERASQEGQQETDEHRRHDRALTAEVFAKAAQMAGHYAQRADHAALAPEIRGLASDERAPCCGEASASAITWNSFSDAVQCHGCGTVFEPRPLGTPESS